jgi:hypothetical protein
MADDYANEVGYRKPPKASQFQKGKSGNPRGRPRENPGIAAVLKKVLKQVVRTNGPNGPQRMTKLEACVTQLVNKAATGDLKAAKVCMQIASRLPELVTASLPIPTKAIIQIVDSKDSKATGQE